MQAVLDAVANAPPPSFSGGGYWEAMHGEMTGYYEVRVPGRHLGRARANFRLFCLLDRAGPGLPGPAIAVLGGLEKPEREGFSAKEYDFIRALGTAYLASSPRSIATLPDED